MSARPSALKSPARAARIAGKADILMDMRMNSRAWPYRFDEVPWSTIATRFHEVAAKDDHFRHMADIVDSILAAGGEQRLAGLTSMRDLVVTPRPVPAEPPIGVVIVRSPSSGVVGAGGVFIEHRSVTGHDDQIFRSREQAVPLFWRFMIEKFGIEPQQTASQPLPRPET